MRHRYSVEEAKQIFEVSCTKQPNGCWEWTKYLDHDGYGKFTLVTPGHAFQFAHRAAFFLKHGEFDYSLFVLHRCDNPPCVNPDHLFLGTAKDNAVDMMRKGRGNKYVFGLPDSHMKAKLTWDDAKTIRHLYFAERRTQQEIGDYFGVTKNNISSIVRRNSWKSAPCS